MNRVEAKSIADYLANEQVSPEYRRILQIELMLFNVFGDDYDELDHALGSSLRKGLRRARQGEEAETLERQRQRLLEIV